METENTIKATGSLEVILKDRYGNVKQQFETHNLVVTVGKNFIASRMVGVTDGVMTHMAIGTGTTDPVAANTTLEAEIARVAFNSAGTSAANVCSYSATFPAGTGTGAVTEAGIFNNSTGGVMLCRTEFLVVNKAADDILTINWNVTVN